MDHEHCRHASDAAIADAPPEFRRVARKVRNWGRWGPDDELGTLNHITPEAIRYAASLVRQGKTISCGVPYDAYGPQGAHGLRRNPIHVMTVDGGDRAMEAMPKEWRGPTEQWLAQVIEQSPGRFTDDYIIMPLQAGTQWDALAHFYYGDQLYNGYPASAVTSLGAARDSIVPAAQNGQVTGRGVLLDVARHRGVDRLGPDEAIPPEELEEVAGRQGVAIRDGDIIVVRTGWRLEWLDKQDDDAWAWQSPGLSWRCAEWFHDRNTAAVACDNVGVERMKPELEGLWSPFHMLALRDMGMMLGEIWDLEALGDDCAADGIYEFQLVAAALPFSGAVGTPLNPIAIK
jgi:kynurenine formamidase